MTPMQALKPQFDALVPLLPGWSQVALNRAKPREYVSRFCGDRTVYAMKGVRSTFIKLFQKTYSRDRGWSMGFSFDYQPEHTDAISANVKATLKIMGFDTQYWTSHAIGVDLMRERMHRFLNVLHDNPAIEDDVLVSTFKSTFDLVPSSRRKAKVR